MIFLSILKIIGIVLACIVGFVLLMVLLVLFAPIQYKIHSIGENSETIITGSAKWIFGFLSLKIALVNFIFGYKIKVAGIKLVMGKIPKDTESEKKVSSDDSSETPSDMEIEDKETFKEEIHDPEESKEEFLDLEEDDYIKFTERAKIKLNEHQIFFKKIKEWKSKYEKGKAFLESKEVKKAEKSIKIQIINLLNHIKPKKITGKLNFGLEEPSNTAIIYGMLGSVTEIISDNKLVVTPEFYQKGVNSDFVICGRIFVGYVVLCFIRLIMDKNVKYLFNAVRRIF